MVRVLQLIVNIPCVVGRRVLLYSAMEAIKLR